MMAVHRGPQIIAAVQATATSALVGATDFALQVSGVTATPVDMQGRLMEYALKEGGLLLVLLIVLYFYRRDYRDVREFWKTQNELLIKLVAEDTKATTEMSAAMRENTIVAHQSKHLIAKFMPERRDT